ncbi:hypothetical protein MY4038_002971 [Beauveria bassiana]
MGSLMNKSDPACRHDFRTPAQWSLYVHAASVLFTLFISTGTGVVVLTPHPPQRLNPYDTSFKIMFVHPRIQAARDDIHEYWPTDRVDEWTARYPGAEIVQRWKSRSWDVKQQSSQ